MCGARSFGHRPPQVPAPHGRWARQLQPDVRAVGRRLPGGQCRDVPADSEAELDLVVLVYGLSAGAIDGVVGETLERLLAPLRVAWAKSASFHA